MTAVTAAGVLDDSGAGQRRKAVRLARAAGIVVGIDFGHRHVTVAIADMAHEILGERRHTLGPSVSARDALKRASTLLDEVMGKVGAQMSEVVGIGMGLPAPIDSRTGEEILALFKRLRDEGHTVVLITHDAHVAAHADRICVMRDGELHEASHAELLA